MASQAALLSGKLDRDAGQLQDVDNSESAAGQRRLREWHMGHHMGDNRCCKHAGSRADEDSEQQY